MLSFESYNQKQFAVRGDKRIYEKIMKDLGGRWNTRMRGGEGWLVSKTQKNKLQQLVDAQGDVSKVVHDHTSQDKYHRERSRSRVELDEDDVVTEDGQEDAKDELEHFYNSFKRTPLERENASPSVSESYGSGSSGNTYDDIEELFETMAFIADRVAKIEKKLEKMEKRLR